MNKQKINIAIATVLVVIVTITTSCKKKETVVETPTVDTDQSGAAANNTAENSVSDILEMGSEACDLSGNGNLNNYRSSGTEQSSLLSCAAAVIDPVNKIVTVTFSGGVCNDGKTRSGSLIYNFSASTNGATRFRHPGFSMSISSSNYVVNGNTVTINNKTVTNTTPVGFNPLTTNQTWSISANVLINLSGGGNIQWSCNRVKTLLNTSAVYTNSTTPIIWSNAKIGLTGTASGARSNGETYTANVTNQLVRDLGGCTGVTRFVFIQGTIVYSPSGKLPRTIDYGNGACDLNATVTINGISYPFIL
jgi:hypothetical protein